jgi:hypothetical protein
LLTNDELLAHLRTVAANLKPDGLYLIDLTHPRDCSLWGYGDFQYTGERDGCRVTIDWATNAPQADPLSGVIDIEVLMRVTEPDGSQHEFRDRARERLLLPQEIVALAERSGVMRVVGWYGDFRLEQPFDNTREARRMICVLSNSPPREAASPRSFVSSKLVVKPSPKHGYGLFANAPINSGDVLVVWAGTVIQTTDLVRLDGSLRGRALQIEEGLHLVGDPEPADYVNHSCMPNAGLSGQVALVARHAIEVGEEICYDYAMSEGTAVAEDAFECCCGTSVCRGRITGEDWCRPDLQSAYAGFFSPYLERRMLARWRTS